MTLNDLIHIIDDDESVRRSLAFLFASDGLLVRLYDSASDFLESSQGLSSGCIISDIRMPGIDGIELLRRLATNGCQLPVIIITGHADIRLAVQAMRLGAFEFLEKPFNDTSLLNSVRSALSRNLANPAEGTEAATWLPSRIEQLTGREKQVFEHLVAGQANKVIAKMLGISHRTVEIHRANVMNKMQARSLCDLVRMSLASGQL